MRTSDFTFELPEKLVAQHPPAARSDARLLHLDGDGRTAHRRFPDLPSLLRPDDLLVRNVTRVIPARVPARKEVGGGRVEVFILPEGEGPGGHFRALTRPALRPGVRLLAGEGHPVRLEVGTDLGGGQREVRIVSGAAGILDLAEQVGRTPLPPYIRRDPEGSKGPDGVDRERYQTVYARFPGSVAAPTAGLHFESGMFGRLRASGVRIVDLVLHVGYGTFAPVRVEDPRNHDLAAERFFVPDATRRAVLAQLADGRRVVAVGTTTVRVLETPGVLESDGIAGSTSLLILPGHRFRVVSAMLTNFHLPGSSLLMLVAALGGTEAVLAAYREAVRERYRFYSYGDAMFVEKRGEGAP
ncbi:MAG: tRNA preQ1(34) S-adenosylmethionine ribosyltransferase-isomerase QueA [Acidobacteria bacterium]|nr:tRNA preQ1(34) S-adenosylmethionine ribosyltransferase-isomerase QueA [Acidobacteriota bacterium]MXW38726.1 tRNA preQ1(34) S-adenosylmethionine ribosyltransferase-isomerase QueA [Acidobacteriota bacterium]MYA45479.1 tRNA preQ1(34) S-adenosylmethionine ribosyltransferase-isomerase QueA [Acidobacteriota bacterium]MYB31684.1 tRNA preQ1(34) S-adenosylmethionine ribosyltransferase-isomerase QueA [Acidobacteriota bacterium]MYH23413.1 tRNA preQ1(34) S-adenosylmethionine ribosyltransferase-isomerase